MRQLSLEGVRITLADHTHNHNYTVATPDGFFYVGDTINLSAENVFGEADHFILSVSGWEDLVQDSPFFNVTFDRVSVLNYV